ncbi:GMC oxidoreductase [Laetiporus sulphureus 93-53]|uniref:GMC oxidoreductase n=1 Tax=Laetiporus sulphureus 93-53 TaxID=1314785 RepID=A0A165B5Y2_9APHY|nr:GMC oxidoreductase [Laetiporus sulphureus 93-53]KZT00313.1 GMC oxidoreductase [Laetiporus sulphureus 93-53]
MALRVLSLATSDSAINHPIVQDTVRRQVSSVCESPQSLIVMLDYTSSNASSNAEDPRIKGPFFRRRNVSMWTDGTVQDVICVAREVIIEDHWVNCNKHQVSVPADLSYATTLDIQLMVKVLSIIVLLLEMSPNVTLTEVKVALLKFIHNIAAKEVDQYPSGLRVQYEMQLELMKDAYVPLWIPDSKLSAYADRGNEAEPHMFSFSQTRLSLFPVVSHPISCGTIHINSADPKMNPTIRVDPRYYYEQEADLEIILDSFKYVRKIAHTEPFKDIVIAEMMQESNIAHDGQLRDGSHLKVTVQALLDGLAYVNCESCCMIGSLCMLLKEKDRIVDPSLKVYGMKCHRSECVSSMFRSGVPLEVSSHMQDRLVFRIKPDIIKK